MNDFELQVMYAVKKGIKLHWGKLIALHMGTFDHKSKYLPYAWLITRILDHYETNFSGYECLMMDNVHHRISIRNVDKRMGVLFDKESLTIKYIDEDVADPNDIFIMVICFIYLCYVLF